MNNRSERSRGNRSERSRGNRSERSRGNRSERSRGNRSERSRGNRSERSRGIRSERSRGRDRDSRSPPRYNRDPSQGKQSMDGGDMRDMKRSMSQHKSDVDKRVNENGNGVMGGDNHHNPETRGPEQQDAAQE